MKLSEWLTDVNGRQIGDGQCWTLAQDYSNRVTNGGNLATQPSPHEGYAIGVWDGYGVSGVEKFYTKAPATSIAGAGWLAIWKYGTSTAPLSHIAVTTGHDYGLTVECMTQNPGPAHLMKISKQGLAGYLVPKNGGTAAGMTAVLAGDNTSGSNPIADGVNAVSGVTNAIANVQHFFATPGQWQRIGIYTLGAALLLAAVIYLLKNDVTNLAKAVS
jgi:hypothetical protein